MKGDLPTLKVPGGKPCIYLELQPLSRQLHLYIKHYNILPLPSPSYSTSPPSSPPLQFTPSQIPLTSSKSPIKKLCGPTKSSDFPSFSANHPAGILKVPFLSPGPVGASF